MFPTQSKCVCSFVRTGFRRGANAFCWRNAHLSNLQHTRFSSRVNALSYETRYTLHLMGSVQALTRSITLSKGGFQAVWLGDLRKMVALLNLSFHPIEGYHSHPHWMISQKLVGSWPGLSCFQHCHRFFKLFTSEPSVSSITPRIEVHQLLGYQFGFSWILGGHSYVWNETSMLRLV